MPIPKIIHQTWKDEDVPEELRLWRRTWQRLNPDYEYRFWTDEQLDAFVQERFPQFYPLFQSYEQPICRVDLGRYLILKAYGGVYVDLDFECLRPIDALLIGADMVIGCEPDEHVTLPKAAPFNFPKILAPSWIASVPDHPFWDHVLGHIEEASASDDVLDKTGPFFLTRAYLTFKNQQSVSLLDSSLLYPLTNDDFESSRALDIEFWERATRDAFAIHYWYGSWWRVQTLPGLFWGDYRVETIGNGPEIPPREDEVDLANLPTISCIMVGRNPAIARMTIQSFSLQRYPNRELILVDPNGNDALREVIAKYPGERIKLLQAPADTNEPALFNLAIDAAEGAYICLWEEGSLSDPQRLEVQWHALAKGGGQASVIQRAIVWRPGAEELDIGGPGLWQRTLLCDRAVMPYFPIELASLAKLVAQITAKSRIVGIDMPRMYLVEQPGWMDVGGQGLWNTPRLRYSGSRYRPLLRELSKRLPLRSHPSAATRSFPLRVDVFGHFAASVGIGAAARATYSALQTAGVPAVAYNIPVGEPKATRYPVPPPTFKAEGNEDVPSVTILHTNPDALSAAGRTFGTFPPGAPQLRDRYRIAHWVWEVEGVPATWRAMLPAIDELWVPSRFVAESVAADVTVPIFTLPYAVEPPEPTFGRSDLGLPDDRFIFLFTFDATSNIDRKNPGGLVEAYKRAFPTGTEGPLLVVKGKKLHGADLARLEALAEDRADISILNETFDDQRAVSLIAACDCYVSLHRAEGFGLSLAEAMYFAKPVIATGFSGNLEFMSESTGHLVRYRMTELAEAQGYYAAGTRWAEPDLDHAAELMQQVYANAHEAGQMGRRAALSIRSELSRAAIGERIKTRLRTLHRMGRTEPMNPQRSALALRSERGSEETVAILTPVKNAEAHLPRYFELLERLDFDKSRLSVAFLESDSDDRTIERLQQWAASAGQAFRRITLLTQSYGCRRTGARGDPAIQRQRRSVLARARNRLLREGLKDEDWALWLDVDLVDYPPDLLQRLLATGKELVVPLCVLPDGRAFDLNSFRIDPGRGAVEDHKNLKEGIFQPPRGDGRLYLDQLQNEALAPLDGVGGTALLVRGDLHRDGLVFPPVSYRGYIETEGLAMMARDMGVTPYGVPSLRVVHTDG